MMKSTMRLYALVTAVLVAYVQAFAPVSRAFRTVSPVVSNTFEIHHVPALQRQRRSLATVQTMGLFGLGVPELAVIAIAAAFLLGPQKLAELGKDAGKIAGELKEVPAEFQKGLQEGETKAKSLKEEISVKEDEEKKDK
jgi:sec-independent protein translocase protein TatA